MGRPPPGAGESRWTDEDRARIAAFRAERSLYCHQCGTRDDEWLDEEGKLRVPEPYVVELVRDIGCQRIEDRLERLRSDKELSDDMKRGLRARLVRNPDLDEH